MNKTKFLLVASLLSVVTLGAGAAQRAVAPVSRPSTLTRTNDGYQLSYKYEAPRVRNWFVGGAYQHTFLFFTEKQDTGVPGGPTESIDRNGVTQMGLNIFGGRKLDDNWRLEGEIGYTGKYSNFYQGWEFSTSAPYVQVGATYNTREAQWGWVYGGLGLGAAFPTTKIETNAVLIGGESKTTVSPLFAAMLGYRTHIADHWFLDLGYKFSTYKGSDIKREWECAGPDCSPIGAIFEFTNKVGWFMNHSIKLGLAYEF
ncbi:MAG: porin family protein [Alphaproteobacteria bacterium]|nr:porin family protein [Alphaproteobacteria bacterium]